jgi:membrane-associated phospholipid phosphatase
MTEQSSGLTCPLFAPIAMRLIWRHTGPRTGRDKATSNDHGCQALQYPLADLIARHVVIVLTIIIFIALCLSAIFWRLVEHYGPRSWSWGVKIWNAFRATPFAATIKRLPLLGRVLASAVTATRYLGVVAVLGFLVALSATVLFFEVADEIGVDEDLAAFDVELSAALREHVSGETLQAFAVMTHLGDTNLMIAIGILVFAYLFKYRDRIVALAWAVATISGGLMVRLLKIIFERSRPIHEHGLVAETSWSFPSGHAAGSMLIYGLLAYLLVRYTKAALHIPAALAGITLIILVGSSRVILQVHYLSDVLAGYMAATVWVAICIAALEAIRANRPTRS